MSDEPVAKCIECAKPFLSRIAPLWCDECSRKKTAIPVRREDLERWHTIMAHIIGLTSVLASRQTAQDLHSLVAEMESYLAR